MREKKRKKTKGKSRLLLDSHKKLHQRPVKKWTGRQNVSPLLLLIIITSHYYYYCCRCTSASNTPAALLLACLPACCCVSNRLRLLRSRPLWCCESVSISHFFFPPFISCCEAICLLISFLLVFFPVLFLVYAWFSPRLATTTLGTISILLALEVLVTVLISNTLPFKALLVFFRRSFLGVQQSGD
jgi:hypothetical protein